MPKRFLFYIDGFSKPVTITDNNENRSLSDLIVVISEMLTDTEMCEFSTENDAIVVKPVDIKGVYIADLSNQKEYRKVPLSKDIDIDLDIVETEPPVKKENVSTKQKKKTQIFEDVEEELIMDKVNDQTPINNVEYESEPNPKVNKPRVISKVPEKKKGEPIIHEQRHIVMDNRK